MICPRCRAHLLTKRSGYCTDCNRDVQRGYRARSRHAKSTIVYLLEAASEMAADLPRGAKTTELRQLISEAWDKAQRFPLDRRKQS